jgi:hypothetical protein
MASLGPVRRGFRFERLKFGRMGVVTAGTEIISPLSGACKVSRSLAVDPYPPASVEIAVALPAESVTFLKIDQFAVVQTQSVAVLCVVAIEAPSHRFGVVQFDVGMLLLQLSLCSIDLHGGVTIAAREQTLRHRRGRDLFDHSVHPGNKKSSEQEHEHR